MAALTNGMLEPPRAQPAAHGVSGVFVPFIFCLASLTIITVLLFSSSFLPSLALAFSHFNLSPQE